MNDLKQGVLRTQDRVAESAAEGVNLRPTGPREREILRVSATLLGDDPRTSAERARSTVVSWAQTKSTERLPDAAREHRSFDHFIGGHNCSSVRVETDEVDLWAIRIDDPDRTVPGRTWTTEVTVGHIGNEPPRFSTRLLVNSATLDLDIEPAAPIFVRRLSEDIGLAAGRYELRRTPWEIADEEEAEHLLEVLVDPGRRFPIFLLSLPRGVDYPYLDADKLAAAVCGMAQVIVIPDVYTWHLTERFGKRMSVFWGAVRTYFPNFTEDADPYSHPLVLGENLKAEEAVKHLTRRLRWTAASESIRRTRLGVDVLSYTSIRSQSHALVQRSLEQRGASDGERLAAANARIEALEQDLVEARQAQLWFSEEHIAAEGRAEAAEAELAAMRYRVEQLRQQIKDKGLEADSGIVLPSTWAMFPDWVEDNLAGRIQLLPAARRAIPDALFSNVPLAAECLLWLANDYRDGRMLGREGGLRDFCIKPGVMNTPCGGDGFKVKWKEKWREVDWHIKGGGNSRDPKRCLRIYYFWDDPSHQVVIAEMPGHRSTGGS